MNQLWLSIFLLPTKVIKRVEKVCNDFLYTVGEGGKKIAKVAWKTIVLPKKESVLDVNDLASWIFVCIMRHIWNLLLRSGSL
ncbi:hypothetical protein LINPERHAP1_LOCUS28620 [Linum perenne]